MQPETANATLGCRTKQPLTFPLSTTESGTPRRPTLILIHGAFQTPQTWQHMVPLLESQGFPVLTPQLHSPGSEPGLINTNKRADFDADVVVIKTCVASMLDAGRDVVLVLHSYAGLVGCEALKGMNEAVTDGDRKGRILHVVFIAALVLPVGAAAMRKGKDVKKTKGFEVKDDIITVLDGPTRFYNDLPPSEAIEWASTLQTQSIHTFQAPLTYPAYRFYPTTYLLCTEDAAIPLRAQIRMASLALGTDPRIIQGYVASRLGRVGVGTMEVETRHAGHVAVIDSGHCPMVSRGLGVLGLLVGIANEACAKREDGAGMTIKCRL